LVTFTTRHTSGGVIIFLACRSIRGIEMLSLGSFVNGTLLPLQGYVNLNHLH
jgi:hypothetical protein